MHDAADQLAAAQAAALKAFNAAVVAGGWTATELGKLGFDEPPKPARARRHQRNQQSLKPPAPNSDE